MTTKSAITIENLDANQTALALKKGINALEDHQLPLQYASNPVGMVYLMKRKNVMMIILKMVMDAIPYVRLKTGSLVMFSICPVYALGVISFRTLRNAFSSAQRGPILLQMVSSVCLVRRIVTIV